MYYEHLIADAIVKSEPGLLDRHTLDCATRAMLFADERLTPEHRLTLQSILEGTQLSCRNGSPLSAELKQQVEALWAAIQDYIEAGVGAVAEAVVWSASIDRSRRERVLETSQLARMSVVKRGMPLEIRKSHPSFDSDNEELWHARRLDELEAIFIMTPELVWCFDESRVDPLTRLGFDPVAYVAEMIARERREVPANRSVMSCRLESLADDGWFVMLSSGVVVCADGHDELPTNVDYEAVVADEGHRAPFVIRTPPLQKAPR